MWRRRCRSRRTAVRKRLQTSPQACRLLNVASVAGKSLLRPLGIAGGAFFVFQTLMASTQIKKFDKTQAKYVAKDQFVSDSDTEGI